MDRTGGYSGQFHDDGLEDISEEEEAGSQEARFSEEEGGDDGDEEDEEEDDGEVEEGSGEEEDGSGEDEEGSGDEEEGSGEEEEEEEGEDDEDWETDDDEEEDILEASDSDNEEVEKCPICLNRFREQDIGTPEACDHIFCLECIQEWAKNVNTCPVDRQVFRLILCKHSGEEKIYKRIPVEDRNTQADDEEEDDTYCEVCGQCDREDRLLLCDGCDQGYHMDCLTPPLSRVPVEEWFCPECADREGWAEEADDYSEMMQISAENEVNIPRRSRRQIPRTLVSERVRSAIEEIRVRRTRSMRIVSSSEEEQDEEETPSADAASTSTSATAATTKQTTKRKTTRRKRTPRKYSKRKTSKKKGTTKKRKTKRKTTKRTTKKTTKGKKKSTKRKRKGKKRKVKCMPKLLNLHSKTDLTKKEKVRKEIQQFKLESGKKLAKSPVKREEKLRHLAFVFEKKGRTARPARPMPVTTPKSRIADSLGLVQPPKGSTIPLQRQKPEKYGESALSIFGVRDELHHFNDEAASPGPVEVQKPSRYSRMALSSYKPIGRVPAIIPSSKAKEKKDLEITESASSGPTDLLGSILKSQNKLNLQSKDILIQKDGSLLEKPKETYKPKQKAKISFSIGKTSPTKTPGSIFKSTSKGGNTSSVFQKSDQDSKKGAEENQRPGLPSGNCSLGFQTNVHEEYDPAHPTDELEDAGANIVETKVIQDEKYNPFSPTGDQYDPFHPTDDMESDEDKNISRNEKSKTSSGSRGSSISKSKPVHSLKDVFDTDFDDNKKVISKAKDKIDEKPKAVSSEEGGELVEDEKKHINNENANDSGTDLEDEIDYSKKSDSVVILIDQKKEKDKFKSDENKHPKVSDSRDANVSAISQANNATAQKGVQQDKQKEKSSTKGEGGLESEFELRKSDDWGKEKIEEKHLPPPKPGFHGGLPQVLLPHQLKVVAKPSDKDKQKDKKENERAGQIDISVKKLETEKKLNPVQKSLEVIKKSQYRNKPLYGEIDFTEDVSCGESGFPQYFEVNMKRIEDAFKDTKAEEEEKDDVEVIENEPEIKPIDLSDDETRDDQQISKEMSVEKTYEMEESNVSDEKKEKSKKQPKVEYVVKVKKDKTAAKEKHEDSSSKKGKKRDKKSNESEVDEKKKSKGSKEKSGSKSEKENKPKKKPKRKISIENDFENEDEDENSYRKELQHVQEIKEPKERRKSRDNKKKIKDEASDSRDHHKSEKVKKAESKKSKRDKKKLKEESHDSRKARDDSYERRKSRDDSYDYDRHRSRDDSYDRHRLREESYDQRRSRADSYDRQKSREDSYERRHRSRSRDHSYDRRGRSRDRSYDRKSRDRSYGRRSRDLSGERSYYRRSRERSHERRRSRDHSYDRRRSRADSYERKKRNDSYEERKAREDSLEEKKSKEDRHKSSTKKEEKRRTSIEETRRHPLLDTYYDLKDERGQRKDKHKSYEEMKKEEQSQKQKIKEKALEKKKAKETHKRPEENKLKLLSIDYESISEDEMSDMDGHVSEIEEGELKEEYWQKENKDENRDHINRERDRRRNRDDRENRTLFYEETEDGEILYSDKARLLSRSERVETRLEHRLEPEQEIDTRIVIEVKQDTENRRVWEEDEKTKKHKKEKEEKRKERGKDSKKDKKNKRHRSISSSGSKEKRKRSRSHSHDKSRKKLRDRSRSHSTGRLLRSFSRSYSRDRSLERQSKRKQKDRLRHRSLDTSSESLDSLNMEKIYSGKEKSWSRSPLKRQVSRDSVEKADRSPADQTLMGSIKKENELSAAEVKGKRKSVGNKADIAEPIPKKTKTTKKTKTAVFLSKAEAKKKKQESQTETDKNKPAVKIPPPPKTVLKELNTKESPIIIQDEEDKTHEVPDRKEEKAPAKLYDQDKREVKILDIQESKDEEKQEEKFSSSDDEPEETEQFSYTDRDEYLLQTKKEQQHSNFIQISHEHKRPPSPPSPAPEPPPPGPDLREGPTPPIPLIGERFVSSPFPPPPPGPPPGMVLSSERPPVHIQVSGPPGQAIFPEGRVLIQRMPQPRDVLPGNPQIIQQGPNIPVSVLQAGLAQGIPQSLRPQRPVLVNAFIGQPPPGFPRLPNSPGPIRILQNPISSQLPSPGAQIPGPQIVNGPFDGLPSEGPPNVPPPGFAPGETRLVQISRETPPPNVVTLHELEGPPIGPLPGALSLPGPREPPLVQISQPPPSLPIPLHLPPPPISSEPPPHSVIVSVPPPTSVIVSVPPPEPVLISVSALEPAPTSVTPLQDELFSAPSSEFIQDPNASAFIRTETPPNLADHGLVSNSLVVSAASSIPGLGDLDTLHKAPVVAVPGVSVNDELPIFSQLEEISKLLNVQAKLKIISSQDKRKAKLKDSSKGDSLFKMPMPPGQKSSSMGGKGDSAESNEVTDMDMGSPIDEEGNIELPVSPQYENLIDKDLDQSVVSPKKKGLDNGVDIPVKTDKQRFDEIFSDQNDEKDDSELEDIQDSFENKLDAIGLLKDIEALTKAINHETVRKDVDLGKSKDIDKPVKKNKHSKENKHKHRHHHKHKTSEEKSKNKDLRLKALTDAHQEIDSQEMPSSAVEMTNKEKYLKKLHLQERVVEEVKMAIKPHYASKDINKEQYKEILRKAVPKICHSKSGDINPMKIKSLVEAYVSKYNKHKTGKDGLKTSDISPSPTASDERIKLKTNR